MFCSNCGARISDESSFCPQCGSNIVPNATAPTQPMQQVPQQFPQQPVYAAPPQQTYVVKEKGGGCLKAVAIVLAIVIALVALLAFTLHKCDNCGDYFLGEGHSFFGARICDDCWD